MHEELVTLKNSSHPHFFPFCFPLFLVTIFLKKTLFLRGFFLGFYSGLPRSVYSLAMTKSGSPIKTFGDDGSEALGDDGSEALGDDGSEAFGDDGSETLGDDGSETLGDDGSEAFGDNDTPIQNLFFNNLNLNEEN